MTNTRKLKRTNNKSKRKYLKKRGVLLLFLSI